ncbi:PTS sugar transporter subunit IIA [Marinilactibacillus psychrotolerans]|uniref:Fructose-specific PTS system IIA component n=2 Tax=Marinilactibacillus psychrotolerans TaxID=191770 RepID=A0A511H0Q5_9LACT|nr:fructose PTS transporter subunit IIA [Marinilactibacillus psychrotolerans]TLQ07796.1 PTS sugar transporter subunit IIA [Marinilactibacillus psychrotolerans]SDC87249.1 PTS system unknown substrate IIA component, Fru family (TC 4.A.2.1.9) [Marinilactibacillus psychrotolerans]SJN23425.1 PTS system, fructose-specific IIA component [Marinilactibacillus psychrotolerans 42ea]GEL67110.1 PTS fructose transporter subunit IIA [Marinilactibacillus psychrotolerans]GEQ35477.1 fructose-specific PTS system
MDLSKIVKEELVSLNMNTHTKQEMLRELSNKLFEKGCIEDVNHFMKDVYLREEEGQTGLGNSIAIPHGKSSAVLKTSIAIGKSLNDLEWESLDDQPVKLVILFAVKESDKTTTHLKMLSQVAVTLADDDVLKGLLESEEPYQIVDLLTKQSV